MTQKILIITKFPHTISSEKFFTIIFSFLIPSYPVICHCVRIHISKNNLNMGSINSDYVVGTLYIVSYDTVYTRSSVDTKIRSDSGGM